ncbi:MAG TPA: lysophospholipid acyltransferase family protein [Geminicoccus sp.]|jgi:1-acyl-sn-glycerol-3-phosphate acyltransferase|uniref:lysophospholipid acyltransferase family protein n=1 Tax=Geminicoccus sp. TaxID=2024832 RepID=UPI002E2F2665|nr:lysophospholipid acyltransferase family protein [Geminicoccus sp.]HEX2528471.1 lysophospholipid acyltransferase family protein [Geminicoccus sp.]
MTLIRSAIFNVLIWTWTLVCLIGILVVGPFLDAPGVRAYARRWERGIIFLLRWVVGIRHEVRGLQHLPAEPVIIASKHQSAWETLTFHTIVHELSVGLKYELTRIPVFGHYLVKSGCIRIDRGAAAKALKSLVDGAERAMAAGRHVMIFPEGTRRSPGAPPDYKPGVAALYKQLGRPCVPVALNSGAFWGRRSFAKRPGTIVIEFLEPIPAGLARAAFMRTLEERIETATARLVAEAGGSTAELASAQKLSSRA